MIYGIGILVAAFSLVGFAILLSSYLSWRCSSSDLTPKISFRMFKSITDINPNGFILFDTWFKYNFRTIEFKSFIDVLRYKRYCRLFDKNKNKKIRIEETAEFIKDVQRDINEYKQTEESKLKQYSDAIIKQVKESTERYEKMRGELYASNNR